MNDETGIDKPNIVYGRLLEAAHLSSYSFGRAVDEHLIDLLVDDRWQEVGPGYSSINDFLRSVDLSAFNLDDKPALHRRIKELQPEASNYAIGEATGTPESTVRSHLGKGAQDCAPALEPAPIDVDERGGDAQSCAPAPTLVAEEPTGRDPSDDERQLVGRCEAGETVVVSMRGHHDYVIAWAEDSPGALVRIDRRTDWGNPFEIPADGDRRTVVQNYERHYLAHKPSLLARLPELRGKVLACWCAPEACHGDVLKRLAER